MQNEKSFKYPNSPTRSPPNPQYQQTSQPTGPIVNQKPVIEKKSKLAYVSLDDIIIKNQYTTKQTVEFAPVIEEAEPPGIEQVANKEIYELRNMVRGKDKLEIIIYCLDFILKELQNIKFINFIESLPESELEKPIEKYIGTAKKVLNEENSEIAKKPKDVTKDFETFTQYFLKYTHDINWINQYLAMYKELLPDIKDITKI